MHFMIETVFALLFWISITSINSLDLKDKCLCAIGPPGAPGLNGHPGANGHNGINGMKGAKGNNGPKGDKGEVGRKGLKGEKGDSMGFLPRKLDSVAFSVVRIENIQADKNMALKFEKVLTNVGVFWNETNSQFVSKTSGAFFFTVHLVALDGRDAYAYIMHNNNHVHPIHCDRRAGYGSGSQSVVLYLKPKDTVWIELQDGSALKNDYSTFSGFIVG